MGTSLPTAEPEAINNIVDLQNSERGQLLLRARQQTYARATGLQIAQLVCVVIVPTIASVVGIWVPALRAYVGAMALFIVVVDALVLDRWMRKMLKLAAQISELFDCEVLQIAWNKFVVGAKPSEEDIQHAAADYPVDSRSLKAIENWYPIEVSRAPLHVARLVCQRANLRYDAKLRSRFTHWLIGIPLSIGCLLVGSAAITNATFETIVMALLAPAAPILVWAIRERGRQRDASDAQSATITLADNLLEEVKAASCGEDECIRKSREFQDAIYARRAANPLIFPLIYHFYREQSESEMNRSADQILKSLGYS